MNKFHTIGIGEFKKTFSLYDNYQDKLIIAELDSSVKDRVETPKLYMDPFRLDQLTLFFVLQGEAQMNVDYYSYKIVANNFLMITSAHLIQTVDMSSDFKAKVLVVDSDFIGQLRPSNFSPDISNFMELRKHPVTPFTQDEMKHIMECITLIKEKIHLRNHTLQPAVVSVAFLAFLLELFNIVIGKRDLVAPSQPTRREELTNNFLALLLEHCKEEHEVSFYASKLFITPQYLTLVLKDITGKTANVLIDQAILLEAKVLLRSQEYTVQQIADILHFADQSVFGKFFKKNAGVSPLEYKRRLSIGY